jgi:predicted outer membrane protein
MRELDDAKRQHLQMLTALDYSKRMVDYHQDRIKRLTAYIAKGVSNDD